MSLLTFGLGLSGGIGGGGAEVYEVELEEPDTIEVTEQIDAQVQLEDADFNVKIVEKITTVTKE